METKQDTEQSPQQSLFDSPTIFTTGAFLSPARVSIKGKDTWVWFVREFIDDTFDDDGDVYNPKEIGRTKKELLDNTTPDD